jgi:hypothetical protein
LRFCQIGFCLSGVRNGIVRVLALTLHPISQIQQADSPRFRLHFCHPWSGTPFTFCVSLSLIPSNRPAKPCLALPLPLAMCIRTDPVCELCSGSALVLHIHYVRSGASAPPTSRYTLMRLVPRLTRAIQLCLMLGVHDLNKAIVSSAPGNKVTPATFARILSSQAS